MILVIFSLSNNLQTGLYFYSIARIYNAGREVLPDRGQLPTQATLAASVYRREKFTLPPSTDSRFVCLFFFFHSLQI